MYRIATLDHTGNAVPGPRLTTPAAHLTAIHMQNRGRVYGVDYLIIPVDDTTPPFGSVK